MALPPRRPALVRRPRLVPRRAKGWGGVLLRPSLPWGHPRRAMSWRPVAAVDLKTALLHRFLTRDRRAY